MKAITPLSAVLLLTLASPAAAQTREFRESVPLQPGGELVFETDKGSVSLTGWDRSEVAVYARIEPDQGEDADYARRAVAAARIDITGGPQRLAIRSNFDDVPYRGGRWNNRQVPHIHYQIQAPRSLVLRLTADRSRVRLQGVSGRFDLQTDRSPLEARDLSGEVQIRMDRGEIRLDGALRGRLTLDTDRTNSRIVAFAIEVDSQLDISRGTVDMSVPDAQRLSVSARTGRRTAFSSDFPLATRTKGWIGGPVNGGGPRLSVDGDRSEVRLRRR